MTKLGPTNRFWNLKIKINPSGSHPTLHPLFFEIQTWNFKWWFIATFSTIFNLSVPSGPFEPPKFHQGFKSLNKDISRAVSQIWKIWPHSRLLIQFSMITFIKCKYTIFLLLRVLNYNNLFLNNPLAYPDPNHAS